MSRCPSESGTILGRKSAEMDVPFLTVIFLENVLGDLFRNLLLSFEWRFYALFHWLLYVFILMTRRYIYTILQSYIVVFTSFLLLATMVNTIMHMNCTLLG